MSKSAGPSAKRQNLLEIVDRFEGAAALYREGVGVSLVCVDQIDAAEKGLSARVTLVPSPGLYNRRASSWRMYSSWDTFVFADDHWSAPYINLTVYFEAGLIEAVVNWSQTVSEEYDRARFDAIGKCIRQYRRNKLERFLSAELGLFWNGRRVGKVTDHVLEDYPDIQGRFAAESLEPELQRALAEYANWYLHGGDDDESAPAALLRDWWLENGEGKRVKSATPIIDFSAGTIEWQFLGYLCSERR